MPHTNRRKRTTRRGAALLTTFILFTLLSVATVTYVNSATQTVRNSRRQTLDIQTGHLCEAGIQSELRALWRPFKTSQRFTNLDSVTTGASAGNPAASLSGSIPSVGNFSAGVIAVSSPDTYTRIVTIRAVGWQDLNANGQLDSTDPQKVVDVVASYQLSRSKVFDYTYFVNNYGWMDGFSQNQLIVNGDMRANGDFTISNGTPTMNGSVYACANDKLSPAAAGLINTTPYKMSNTDYNASFGTNPRARQAFNSTTMGNKGTAGYENWRDFIFESSASIVNNKLDGSALADTTGTYSWQRTNSGSAGTKNLIDPFPTDEVVMPDLSDISYYQNLSNTYVDNKATYGDGTANPNAGQGAWVKVWDATLNSGAGGYRRVDTNGVVTGSAALIGSNTNPILIHGPVTFTQDCVIKGTVSGQGTIYTGRNVHIVGSLTYKDPPDFRGTNQTTIDNNNEKKDMIGLAARGSVIMGNTTGFTDSYPLQYMMPPFTHGRYDDNGNYVPAFNAKEVDSTGKMKYQSTFSDSYINSISSAVTQVDAILYTNFVGGGNLGTGGGGVQFNGSIISKDEAMVIWSLPMYMNYDSRIRERNMTQTPLIDINLPRSPVMLRSAWKDRGFVFRTGVGG